MQNKRRETPVEKARWGRSRIGASSICEAGQVPPVKGIKDFAWASCTPHNDHFEVMQLSLLAGGHIVKQAQVDCGNARCPSHLKLLQHVVYAFAIQVRPCKHWLRRLQKLKTLPGIDLPFKYALHIFVRPCMISTQHILLQGITCQNVWSAEGFLATSGNLDTSRYLVHGHLVGKCVPGLPTK